MKKIVLFVFMALMAVACKTVEYVPVVKTEVEYRDRIEKDTLVVKDSVYIHQKGDTVYQEKYKYIYKEHTKVDTAYIYSCDTITKVQTVEKQLTSWQETKMKVGGWCMGILILLVVCAIGYGIYKIYKR